MRILDRQYPIPHIFLIITIIIVPLFIIYHYESCSLNIADTNGYLKRIQELKNQVNELIMNLTFTEKYNLKMKELLPKLGVETTTKQTQHLLAGIEANIQQNNVMGVYSNFIRINIINVLISSQLWLQKQTIRLHVLQSLAFFNSSLQMSLRIIEWQQGILLETKETSTFLIFQEFRSEFIDKNLANRLQTGEYRNSYYLKQIAKQLRSLPSFSHCKYTNYDCSQKTLFFVQHSQKKTENYWKIDKEILIVDQVEMEIIFNAVSEILYVNQIMLIHQWYGINCRQMYADIQLRAYLYNTNVTLNYLSFIFQEQYVNWSNKIKEWLNKPNEMMEFMKKGRYKSPYIHNRAELQQIDKLLTFISYHLNGKSQQKIKFDPLSDNMIGVIDTFPNDFRIGVYIPLLVLFITPLINKILEVIKVTLKNRTARS